MGRSHFIVTAALLLLVGCGGSSGGGTLTTACSDLSLDTDGNVGVTGYCGTLDSTISGIQYDEFSRVIAYDFDLTCQATGKHYTGHVTLGYNNLGQVISGTLVSGGQVCATIP
jgi:hypothetical protein